MGLLDDAEHIAQQVAAAGDAEAERKSAAYDSLDRLSREFAEIARAKGIATDRIHRSFGQPEWLVFISGGFDHTDATVVVLQDGSWQWASSGLHRPIFGEPYTRCTPYKDGATAFYWIDQEAVESSFRQSLASRLSRA